jgi:hypothetical protein
MQHSRKVIWLNSLEIVSLCFLALACNSITNRLLYH